MAELKAAMKAVVKVGQMVAEMAVLKGIGSVELLAAKRVPLKAERRAASMGDTRVVRKAMLMVAYLVD